MLAQWQAVSEGKCGKANMLCLSSCIKELAQHPLIHVEISYAQGHWDPELSAEEGWSSKAEFSVSKSGLLVILVKLSYPLYHPCKCTEKTKSGYNYLFTFGGLGGKKMLADGKPLLWTIKMRPCSPKHLIHSREEIFPTSFHTNHAKQQIYFNQNKNFGSIPRTLPSPKGREDKVSPEEKKQVSKSHWCL